MAYKKRQESKFESLAEVKLNAIKNFDLANGSAINLGSPGNSLTAEEYEQKIIKCRTFRDELNTFLEGADGKVNELNSELKSLRRMSSEILSGIKSRFGSDSNEYEQAGGKRISERKKPAKKKIVA